MYVNYMFFHIQTMSMCFESGII